MSETSGQRTRISRWPIILTLILVSAFGVIFLVEFTVASQRGPEDPAAVIADYEAVVSELLVDANPENGARLVNDKYECHACHVQGAGQVAPGYDLLGVHAVELRPQLQPEAYLYEAIVYPAAYVVEGYPNAMPQNYGSRLTNRELADIIAYLMTNYVQSG